MSTFFHSRSSTACKHLSSIEVLSRIFILFSSCEVAEASFVCEVWDAVLGSFCSRFRLQAVMPRHAARTDSAIKVIVFFMFLAGMWGMRLMQKVMMSTKSISWGCAIKKGVLAIILAKTPRMSVICLRGYLRYAARCACLCLSAYGRAISFWTVEPLALLAVAAPVVAVAGRYLPEAQQFFRTSLSAWARFLCVFLACP